MAGAHGAAESIKIMNETNSLPSPLSRRRFLSGTVAAAAASSLPALDRASAQEAAPAAPAPEYKRKIKLGVIGNGGRGAWIARLFKRHGGYEMHAVADYFPEVANKCGEELGVDPARRFSTLSGYKRVLESGVEAVALEVPPYFLPEQAYWAVHSGIHVYMAKPVASSVPDALAVRAAGIQASERHVCLMVDYQIPTDPGNQEVIKRIKDGGIGAITQIMTTGFCKGFPDPARTANMESRLQHLTWVNDIAMGCDYIGNFDIHAIDAALWVMGHNPSSAVGSSRICRTDPHGDAHDVCSVVFEYPEGVVHSHCGQAFKNQVPDELNCRVLGKTGFGMLSYWGKAQIKSFDDAYSAQVEGLYEAGAVRNIAKFYKNITEGHFENETVERAVDGALVCILGREAAGSNTRVGLVSMIKKGKRLEVDLTGLKT
jgi:predicted dehydrogenase